MPEHEHSREDLVILVGEQIELMRRVAQESATGRVLDGS